VTFREFMVLLRLYHAAPPDLRRWADRQLPELREAAEMTRDVASPPRDVAAMREYGKD